MTHRTTKLSGAFLIAASLSACAHPTQIAASGPATVTVRSATAGTQAMTIAHSANEWLVWSRAKSPSEKKGEPFVYEQTSVIDSQGQVTSQMNGIAIAVSGETWRWQTESRSVDLEPCTPDNAMETTVQTASMVHADGPQAGKQAQLLFKDYFSKDHGAGDGEAALTMGAVTQSFSLNASVGPYLFVREHTWLYSCGAHGFWGASQHIVDLRTGKEATVAFPDADTVDAKAAAADAFVAQYASADGTPAYSPLQETPTSDSVRFVATEPRFDVNKMGFVNIYLAGVAYMDSGSDWASYTVETELPTITLDDSLAEQSVAPFGVTAYVKAHPDRIVGGWSER